MIRGIPIAAIFIATAGAPRAFADLLVSGWGGVFNDEVVARYDETTGAFLGYLNFDAEAPPAGVTVGLNRDLYVAGNAFGMGLLYRLTGAAPGRIVSFSENPPEPNHGWTGPQAIAFGADGTIYVTSNSGSGWPTSTNGILRYATDGTYLGKFADTPGSYITFSPGGDLVVNAAASGTGGNIERFRAGSGAPLGTFVSNGSGGLGSAAGIAFGPDQNFYAADADNDQVLRFDGTTGALIDVFVAPGTGGLDRPRDITFGPDGNLYVAVDRSILRYNGLTGGFIDAFVPFMFPPTPGNIQPVFITFGTVPEPTGAAIAICGAATLLRSRRFRALEHSKHPLEGCCSG